MIFTLQTESSVKHPPTLHLYHDGFKQKNAKGELRIMNKRILLFKKWSKNPYLRSFSLLTISAAQIPYIKPQGLGGEGTITTSSSNPFAWMSAHQHACCDYLL